MSNHSPTYVIPQSPKRKAMFDKMLNAFKGYEHPKVNFSGHMKAAATIIEDCGMLKTLDDLIVCDKSFLDLRSELEAANMDSLIPKVGEMHDELFKFLDTCEARQLHG